MLCSTLQYFKLRMQRSKLPYLALWDKISQNLAYLEASSHKILQISENFQSILNTFYEEININHTLLSLLQASYI